MPTAPCPACPDAGYVTCSEGAKAELARRAKVTRLRQEYDLAVMQLNLARERVEGIRDALEVLGERP